MVYDGLYDQHGDIRLCPKLVFHFDETQSVAQFQWIELGIPYLQTFRPTHVLWCLLQFQNSVPPAFHRNAARSYHFTA